MNEQGKSEGNKLEVLIDGRVYTLTGDRSEEYFLKIGRYIDKKISEAKSVKPITTYNFDLNTLYIVINITDDLFNQTDRADKLETELKENAKRADKLADEIKKLKEKLAETERKLDLANKELNEYIDVFDKKTSAKG